MQIFPVVSSKYLSRVIYTIRCIGFWRSNSCLYFYV